MARSKKPTGPKPVDSLRHQDKRANIPTNELRATVGPAVKFLSCEPLLTSLPDIDLTDIDWVIVGGESGPGARPIQQPWVAAIRDTCEAAQVPFFFKQWGGTRKKKAGRELDGREWLQTPATAHGDEQQEMVG